MPRSFLVTVPMRLVGHKPPFVKDPKTFLQAHDSLKALWFDFFLGKATLKKKTKQNPKPW